MELVGLVCGRPGTAEEPFLVFHRGRGLHGSLLGRFTRLGRDIADAVRAYVHEEGPNTLVADIDLLPAAAMGTSISRVSLHPARITYDDRRTDGGALSIRPDDLRIQLDRGRFRVLSTALGCQVALRLTHSHAFWTEDNPPGYRLLGHLARHPDRVGLVFPWGELENTRWLPRVTRGRHVVSVARWTFDREEIAAWFAGDRDLARGAIARARLRYSIPRHVILAEGDHLLAMDLESDASVLACARALPAAGDVTLFEALGIGGDAAASGPEGRFACEVVVPFRRVDMAAPAVPWRPMLSPSPKAVRSHPPGGEWTYLKLYSGARSADRLLTDLVAPLVADVRRELGNVPWFFVRHADPDDHLRVRVRTRSPAGAKLILERLTRRRPAFERDGSLLRTTLDTYDREVERYGGFETIERAERVFHRDSEACVQLLSDEELDLAWDPGARWLAALLSLYRFLHLLPLSAADRLAWLAAARASTWKLSGFARDYEGELSRRFRAHRTAIERFLAGQDARARRVARMLDARDPKIATELQAIARLERGGRTTASLGDIARSLGHLLVTRMMRAPARGEELLLLDALHRHERSVAGRARPRAPTGHRAPAAPAPGTGARKERT
jgi:thiopeptide-type bacteriocin biosynthesis protein